eukprot:1455310-Rhodomonas_salina.1
MSVPDIAETEVALYAMSLPDIAWKRIAPHAMSVPHNASREVVPHMLCQYRTSHRASIHHDDHSYVSTGHRVGRSHHTPGQYRTSRSTRRLLTWAMSRRK